MKACVLARPGHQAEWGGAFAAGLRRHGWQVDIRLKAEPCDMLVVWGVRRRSEIAAKKASGGEVCVLERGYLGDRFKWTSVSFGGGLNGRAEFRGVRSDPARFEKHFGHLMQPWQKRDGYALLIGQVPGDMSLRLVGGDLSNWYRETTAELIRHGYDVRFRPHPRAVQRGIALPPPVGAEPIGGTLEEAIAGASLVVTFNSNTGVESVLAGVPTMAADGGSMAWEVTSHHVHAGTVTPDRAAWAHALAWKQWSLAEIRSGACWEAVGQRAAVAA